jgi:hypothetical protein
MNQDNISLLTQVVKNIGIMEDPFKNIISDGSVIQTNGHSSGVVSAISLESAESTPSMASLQEVMNCTIDQKYIFNHVALAFRYGRDVQTWTQHREALGTQLREAQRLFATMLDSLNNLAKMFDAVEKFANETSFVTSITPESLVLQTPAFLVQQQPQLQSVLLANSGVVTNNAVASDDKPTATPKPMTTGKKRKSVEENDSVDENHESNVVPETVMTTINMNQNKVQPRLEKKNLLSKEHEESRLVGPFLTIHSGAGHLPAHAFPASELKTSFKSGRKGEILKEAFHCPNQGCGRLLVQSKIKKYSFIRKHLTVCPANKDLRVKKADQSDESPVKEVGQKRVREKEVKKKSSPEKEDKPDILPVVQVSQSAAVIAKIQAMMKDKEETASPPDVSCVEEEVSEQEDESEEENEERGASDYDEGEELSGEDTNEVDEDGRVNQAIPATQNWF